MTIWKRRSNRKGGHLHFHKVITYQLHGVNLQTKYKKVHLYSVISTLRKACDSTSSSLWNETWNIHLAWIKCIIQWHSFIKLPNVLHISSNQHVVVLSISPFTLNVVIYYYFVRGWWVHSTVSDLFRQLLEPCWLIKPHGEGVQEELSFCQLLTGA